MASFLKSGVICNDACHISSGGIIILIHIYQFNKFPKSWSNPNLLGGAAGSGGGRLHRLLRR